MSAADDDDVLLVPEISVPIADPRPTTRLAHLLLLRANPAQTPTPRPLDHYPGAVLGGDVDVDFKGWPSSPPLWNRWLRKLRPRHEPLWRKVGILDAILVTACRIRRDEDTLLQLATFWSGETNTFVFPWGEATVTLEDATVLGGLPLVSRPVRARLPREWGGDFAALEAARSATNRSTGKKPRFGHWAKRFLERPPGDGGAGDRVEHAAFLSMWLSLFVLAAPPFNVVRSQVLPLAVRLARGQRVALAPAALASIYHDLSALKCYLGSREEPFVVWAPMHILQLWVWERFPALQLDVAPHCPSDCRQPRAARWHNVHEKLDPGFVRAVFMLPREFEWRPYGIGSFAWVWKKCRGWVHARDVKRSKDLKPFAHCLRACELVGMDCIEQYLPHRVSRQLGFDQDVPGTVACVLPNGCMGNIQDRSRECCFLHPTFQAGRDSSVCTMVETLLGIC